MEHNLLDHVRTGWNTKKTPILAVGGVVISLILVVSLGTLAYVEAYDGKIYPNVWIDSMNVGGMTQEEAYQLIDARVQKILDDGLRVEVEGQILTIYLRTSGADDPDLVSDRLYVDVDGVVEAAMEIGRGDQSRFVTSIQALGLLFGNAPTLTPEVTILQEQLEETIRALLVARGLDVLEDPGEPTRFSMAPLPADGSYDSAISIVEGTYGTKYDFNSFFDQIKKDVQRFDLSTTKLELIEQDTIISQEAAEALIPDVADILFYAPYELTYESQTYRTYTWSIEQEDILAWLTPHINEQNQLSLTLVGESFDAFIDDLHDTIDVQPTDARFAIEGNRVTEFSGSQSGVEVNEEATFAELMERWGQEENVSMEITTDQTEADVTTDSVNNLGINEILGVGVSDFSGSPPNRIANIIHGADKLNGILLAPGETLSLIDELGPFTVADGYLPELVIKGDEIKPEIGGGLCQIGTTAFRATMNSGLEVVERRNHSLVVSYYNDPSNGNPGTDATIYDPAPDYKMRNDTENYILLTTEVNMDTYELIFTFWGTNDGRHGYYSQPEILSWNGYGETEYIETLDLEPGVEQCQSPHPGATASFTYYVDYADGEQYKKTYTSTYRSLPMICLVGVEELSCDPEEEECEEEVNETQEDEEGTKDDEEEEESSVDEELVDTTAESTE